MLKTLITHIVGGIRANMDEYHICIFRQNLHEYIDIVFAGSYALKVSKK